MGDELYDILCPFEIEDPIVLRLEEREHGLTNFRPKAAEAPNTSDKIIKI